jgi:hypothetical protein
VTNWDKALEAIDLESQLAKCENCPCSQVAGCISCGHYHHDCADSDCSTSHIIPPGKLRLCSADDCVMTMIKLQRENEQMKAELGGLNNDKTLRRIR